MELISHRSNGIDDLLVQVLRVRRLAQRRESLRESEDGVGELPQQSAFLLFFYLPMW
jgi:hypothetical protein